MPHTTQSYPFECKVLEFASKLSATLAGANRTFLIVFDEAGAVRSLTFERIGSSWHEHLRELEESGHPHLFHDPFDAAEYIWLSWHWVSLATMERLLGRPFEDADFIRRSAGPARAPELQPPRTFPSSWGVMF